MIKLENVILRHIEKPLRLKLEKQNNPKLEKMEMDCIVDEAVDEVVERLVSLVLK